MRSCTRCPLPLTMKDAVPDGDGFRHETCLTNIPLPKRERPKFKYFYEMTDEEKHAASQPTQQHREGSPPPGPDDEREVPVVLPPE